MAVPADAIAVTALTPPENQYAAFYKVHTSIKWVAPQKMIKAPNSQKIIPKGSAPLDFRTRMIRVVEMAT